MAIDRNILDKHAINIQSQLGQKLIELKRKASGNLINSFTHVIEQPSEFQFVVKIMGANYWRVVEYGVPAQNVPYSPNARTGAENSAYINGLINWIKIKGIASNNEVIRNIAFAIATKQASSTRGGGGRGNPMDKSKLGFIAKTERERRNEIEKMAQAFQVEIVTLINSVKGNIEFTI